MICPECGKEIGDTDLLCEHCGAVLAEFETEEEFYEEEADVTVDPEAKPLKGFLGAMIGAFLSCLVVALLPQIGVKASFAGLIVVPFIFIGYSLLCKGKTKSGLGVCIMFALITPYIAHQVNWAIWLAANVTEVGGIPVAELSAYQKFLLVPTAVTEDVINVIEYFMDLFKLYIFAMAGAAIYVGTVMRARRKKRAREMRGL